MTADDALPDASDALPPASGRAFLGAVQSGLNRAARWWRRHDSLVYAWFTFCCTLYTAATFYGYLRVQTGGVWSAPLDDVFIHFDYARSFARGYPFHWSEGNGYSSGNTSLTYPLVLALGYWAGFRGLMLAAWSATVASVSVFWFLICAGRLVAPPRAGAEAAGPGGIEQPWPRWIRFLFPPAVLSLGALDWTLFSGMENAFHLGVWGSCLLLAVRQTEAWSPSQAQRRAWALGLMGALLVATRPESGVCVAAFGFYCAWHNRRPNSRCMAKPSAIEAARPAWRRGWFHSLRTLVAVGLPGVLLLIGHGVANRTFTGEWSANGSIAKLFINNPFMSAADKWERYQSLWEYIVPRLLLHHFTAVPKWAWIIPLCAALPLLSKKLRAIAVLLWVQIVAWMAVVALNNQLRWHNERYSMPAVAWLLLLAAMGIGVLAVALSRAESGDADKPPRLWLARLWPARLAAAVVLVLVYWQGQAPRMADQIWFFGRASRNILHQHVTAGKLVKRMRAKRVLVGDAGAITYISDRPGLDLIGLGGYHDYPMARSTLNGLGAALEQIERIPVDDRPDTMALYPSWWGDLPVLFGTVVAAVPVQGNVICGGYEKVIYRANWQALDRRAEPRTLRTGERVFDQLDVADLVSERSHNYQKGRSLGFISYRVLGEQNQPRRDLFDAGRIVPPMQVERAQLRKPPGSARLIVRLAPIAETSIEFRVNGTAIGTLLARPLKARWQELNIALPRDVAGPFELQLQPLDGESIHYHLWVVADDGRAPVSATPPTPR